MKKLQIAVLGILGFSLLPGVVHAQDRYEPYPPNYPSGPAYYDHYDPGCSHHDRTAAIVGGSTLAGAIIGGAAGHGRGAAIGAFVGGMTGLIIDQAAREHERHERREREYR